MNDIFTYMNKKNKEKIAPLAYRLRPKNLSEIVGQKDILGLNKPLRKLIEADKISSIILYGQSGTGKTSIAQVISNTTKSEFIKINATTSSKADLVKVIEHAKEISKLYEKKTILFIDEIHRFNKAQQDYLLPFVEDATISLIGATTENPYFEVNPALLSRSIIFMLNPLSYEESNILINRGIDFLKNEDNFNISIEKKARELLINRCGGDARKLLQYLDTLAIVSENGNITKELVQNLLTTSTSGYDVDEHYDTISAFIKSIRGSNPDAGLYYLARMLEAGEDIKFISRRLMILASEDIGNADPMALLVATNASQAVERVGFAEGKIILAQATIYLSCAPKSNASYMAINNAIKEVAQNKYKIPNYLKDAHYSNAKYLEAGVGYKYPHDYEGSYVNQEYLPTEIKDLKFYYPKDIGYEKEIKINLEKIRGKRDEA